MPSRPEIFQAWARGSKDSHQEVMKKTKTETQVSSQEEITLFFFLKEKYIEIKKKKDDELTGKKNKRMDSSKN